MVGCGFMTDAVFQEYMRGSRVFILGAGFSAAAGVPLTSDLLRLAMTKFKAECPGIFERVNNYASDVFWKDGNLDYSSASFSELCTYLEFIELREYGGGERWSDDGSREKLALRFYLAKTIVENTPFGNVIPPIYLDFARQLNERDVVISFNWDGLLENALRAIGKDYSYNFEEDRIRLCKLHGSVNWRVDQPTRMGKPVNTLGWRPIGFLPGMMEKEIWHSDALLQLGNWEGRVPLGEVQPFLVLPGYGKAFDVRQNAISWYKPEFAFTASRDTYVIGLSLAQDDHFVRSLFLYCFRQGKERHLFVINPAADAAQNYEFVLRRERTKLLQEPFSQEHVNFFRERRET
jgi:hypothetical protein